MKQMQFTTQINASKEKVWNTLWQDETFRQWAGFIDPGTYIVGDLEEGNEIQFLSAGGYGVTSHVEKLVPSEYMLFKHKADTQDDGLRARKDEWTGGEESYTLAEDDGLTTLTVTFGVPPEQVEHFTVNYPKALERVKQLAEEN